MSEARFSELFPQLRVRDMTGIRVYVTVPTADGDRQFEVASLSPEASVDKILEEVGDGVYKLEALGASGTNQPPQTLEVREISVARGAPPLWKPRIAAILSGAGDQDDFDPEPSRYGRERGRFRDRAPSDDAPPSFRDDFGMGPMGSPPGSLPGPGFPSSPSVMGRGGFGLGGDSGDPVVVPLGPDESLPIARGLSPDEQQKRIDEARAERRERLEGSKMMEAVMVMLQQQAAAAEKRAEAAQQQSNELLRAMVDGRSGPARPEQNLSTSEYRELIEEGRRTRQELENRIADMRRDREDVDRGWRERLAQRENELRQAQLEIYRLTGELEKARIQIQIDKLAAAGGLDAAAAAAKNPDMPMEEKLKLVMGFVQSAMPMVSPLIQQFMGGGGQPPSPGLPGGGGGGDLPGL